MPTLKQTDGFTLIELLVVIVIISIVSGIALMTISFNRNKDIERVAHELTQMITLAEHEAMLRPATLGLGVTSTSYQFFILKPPNHWQPLTHRPFSLRHLPNNIELQVNINNQLIQTKGQPIIFISPSSDLTPFIIYLNTPNQQPSYQLIGEANGQIKISPIDPR